jgi:integrase
VQRERIFTSEEIAKVWEAASDFPHGAIVRLLLATGQRRGEVGGIRWSELDLGGCPRSAQRATGIILFR